MAEGVKQFIVALREHGVTNVVLASDYEKLEQRTAENWVKEQGHLEAERDQARNQERQRIQEALGSVQLNDASSEPLRKTLLAWVDLFHTGPDGAEQAAFETVVAALFEVAALDTLDPSGEETPLENLADELEGRAMVFEDRIANGGIPNDLAAWEAARGANKDAAQLVREAFGLDGASSKEEG